MSSIVNILPALAFLLILLSISAYIQRTSKENRQKDFAKDYFIGGRTLGGFVLAMTTAATYSSVSTFVGGPGVAWVIGDGWLYMAIVQVVVIFPTFWRTWPPLSLSPSSAPLWWHSSSALPSSLKQ